ncbi:hypothetical protein D9619_011709 [Psilocybe cf. subviscida]|uniref:DH domain-containing protein n=1 Tax=Psilocybe cf. subviscida TaxID=2480587 RepID=A0A8H5F9L0_9AGAR|nr:hypothetical protein D9619_011709 [Psilocybe cf. subviscida]
MATVAGRKKSIISTIDTNNTLLNKPATQSTSLYQQCSALRSRLMRIRGFAQYFENIDSRQSTDPVNQMWDLFSSGISLCYIFDQLPEKYIGGQRLNNSSFNELKYEANPDKEKKHAIALFAIRIRSEKVMKELPGLEEFTISDLWNRNSTNGLVKVVNTVTAIVDHLPPDSFEESPPSPRSAMDNGSTESLSDTLVSTTASTVGGSAQSNITREMVETERKYVQDLEIMQKYSTELAQNKFINQDTIHLLFPNLNQLLNFQRKFLIRLESTAEQAWQDQRWGQHFVEMEDEFSVYEPYCANYTNASELMLANEESLSQMNYLINVRGELPGLLIKPIQRICKYPLLLDSLLKACSPATYSHFDELKRGSDAAKRITDKINEAQRRAENEQTVKSLHSRIDDWKGHHLENFGDLLLDDLFVVTKSDIDREYHVFLFERIILCCKEAVAQPAKGGKGVGKNGSILKKQPAPPPLQLPGGMGTTQKNTPLLLKGRIFLGNVTQAVPVPSRALPGIGVPAHFPLAVWWKGDDDLEYFTLRCRREDQMRQWESTINRLIKEAAQRRAAERGGAGMSMSRIVAANSTNPSPHARLQAMPHYNSTGHVPQTSTFSQGGTVRNRPSYSASQSYPAPSPYDDDSTLRNSSSTYGAGPHGYPPHDGFDLDPDEDDLEDYPIQATSSYSTSGRGTPVSRRNPNSLSMPMPADRESSAGYDRPRAVTEGMDGQTMSQWRQGGGLPPVPVSAQPTNSQLRPPITPRMPTNSSAASYQSDASFGNGLSSRPTLRTHVSSTRLRSGYDSPNGVPTNVVNTASASSNDYRKRSGTPTMNALPPPPVMNRSRSASQPSAYIPAQPKPIPPPLPSNPSMSSQQHWGREHRQMSGVPTNVPSGKRGSGSSQSTGESSDYSPNSSSPITPFGSSESSLTGVGIRNSRSQQNFGDINGHDGGGMYSHTQIGPAVKVKVHFHEDIFVIQVPRSTEYDDLVEKVGRKIRLCGPRREDGPLRVKYRDEDGDMVSVGSTEDVQMAFEQYRPGGQVTLFVT